jgi:CheY-like chemotaxis protein
MLLDMQMPGMSGVELIKQIKRFILDLNSKQDTIIMVEPEFIIVTAYVTATLIANAKK